MSTQAAKIITGAPVDPELAKMDERGAVYKSWDEIEVSAISSTSMLNGIEEEWRALEEQSPNSTLFQSWAWCRYFLEHSKDFNDFEMKIIVIRAGGQLVGLVPLKITTLRGMRLLTGLSEPYQQYTEMLATQRLDFIAVREKLSKFMKSLHVDYWHFGQVREGGDLARLLEGVAKPSGERDASPFVEIANWQDFGSYYQSVKSKTRKNMRNGLNRLERSGLMTHQFAVEGALLAEVIDRTFDGRKAWLERLGITSRAFNDEQFATFLAGFKDTRNTGVEVLAMSMKHAGHAIADQWGFIYKGRYYAFMASWDESYGESSPGKLHLGRVIETCFDMNLNVVDFMIPDVDYKRTWAANAIPVCDYITANSVKGYLYTQVWINFLRPLAKKILYFFPPALRQMCMKMVLPFLK